MHRFILSLSFLLITFSESTFGQDNSKETDAYYFLNENWKNTTADSAKYFIREKKMNDTCWQFDVYNLVGPMVRSERYKDEKGAIAHGMHIIYKPSGQVDSICYYFDGLENDRWLIYNDTGGIAVSLEYAHGNLLSRKDYSVKDSTTVGLTPPNAITEVEVESEFPGKAKAWSRFLNNNLNYPKRAMDLLLQGTATIHFQIDTEGALCDPFIFHSVEFSIDEEALRIIRKSPKWTPAVKNGKKVRSWKIQPIMFRL